MKKLVVLVASVAVLAACSDKDKKSSGGGAAATEVSAQKPSSALKLACDPNLRIESEYQETEKTSGISVDQKVVIKGDAEAFTIYVMKVQKRS